MIGPCLAAAGVRCVIWIDDAFLKRGRDELSNVFQASLRKLHSQPTEQVLKIPHFPTFDLKLSLDDLMDVFEAEVGKLTDNHLRESTSVIEHLAEMQSVDLTPTEFASLCKEIGPMLKAQSLSEWEANGIKTYHDAGPDTLFLIDREYHRERRFDGISILKDICVGNAYYMMFTCDCSENQQEEKRLEYSRTIGIPAHRFAVISKRGTGDLAQRVARSLRTAFTHRQTAILAEHVKQAVIDASKQVLEDLAAQSVEDLDHAIFESSMGEGASELDVLLRIFSLQQRNTARKAFQATPLRQSITAMREFRTKTAKLKLDSTEASLIRFREWRKMEIFEDGDSLNPLHSALACGDVFKVTEGSYSQKEFVLLAQPCDLVVRTRPKGKRIAEVGLLIPLLTAPKRPDGKNPTRYHEIVSVLPSNNRWFADFKSVCSVDLSLLDCCVFNCSGEITLSVSTTVAPGILTAGYELALATRIELLKKLIADPNHPVPPLALGQCSSAISIKLDRTGEKFSAPLKRIGRIESSVAHGILAAWASFQTRAALDHDFSQSEDEYSGTPCAAAHPIENGATLTNACQSPAALNSNE